MIVYVDQAGKPPEFYAAGWHDRKNKIPAYPQALFKIASITKLYVAVAAAKLVKAGRSSLDKTLAEYFPELAGRIEYSDKITLRMLLQHRSGIPNFVNHPDYWKKPPKSRQETLDYALDLPADFEPGEDYGYSNTNYMLIEDLIDKTLSYPHQQYIKEEILNPLGLKSTFGSLSEVDIDNVMSGYYVGVDEDFKYEDTGLMLATAEDVGIFLRALNDGSVFKEGGTGNLFLHLRIRTYRLCFPATRVLQNTTKTTTRLSFNLIIQPTSTDTTWTLAEIVYKSYCKNC